jgi:UDP-galactose transporter B1
MPSKIEESKQQADSVSGSVQLHPAFKLLIGAGGIYTAFLYYGTLQEEVFHYVAADGGKFQSAWFLQTLEALANVAFGGMGMWLSGATNGIPKAVLAASGFAQVSAKAFTSLALANGVSFPVVTLAKSGKMVPVMLG